MMLTALDEKLANEGYAGKSAVIAYLLDEFLEVRANHVGQEMVRVTTLVDRNTYTKLAAVAGSRQQQVEELISELCKDSANQLRGNTV